MIFRSYISTSSPIDFGGIGTSLIFFTEIPSRQAALVNDIVHGPVIVCGHQNFIARSHRNAERDGVQGFGRVSHECNFFYVAPETLRKQDRMR